MDKYWEASGTSLDPFGEFLGWVMYILTLIPAGIGRLFGIQFYFFYMVE